MAALNESTMPELWEMSPGLRFFRRGSIFRHSKVMILTLARASTDTGFSTADFYVTVATIIPVLFLALAFEGHFIGDLLKALMWAEDAWYGLVMRSVSRSSDSLISWLTKNPEAATETPPKRETGLTAFLKSRLKRGWGQLGDAGTFITLAGGLFVAFTPALLAACIIVYGTASEVVVILVLYYQDAASWTGPFVVTGVIFLVVMVAIAPAFAVVRAVVREYRGTSSESVPDRAGTTQQVVSPGTGPDRPAGTGNEPGGAQAPER
jgi:hypothetical protein